MSSARESSQNSEILCIISGNVGFLGFELAKQLLSQGCKVLSIGIEDQGNAKQLSQLKTNPKFSFIGIDKQLDLKSIADQSPDYIFHLSLVDIYETYDQEVDLQHTYQKINIDYYLELSQKTGAKLLITTIESVYEDGAVLGQLINNSVLVRDIFWQVQTDTEQLIVKSIKETDINARIVRISDPCGYGISSSSPGITARLIQQAIESGVVIVPNEGLENIYPTHCQDIAFGMIKCMFSQSSKGKMFALINKEGVSLLSIAHIIKKYFNNSLQIKFLSINSELKLQGVSSAMVNSQEVLGWFARISIDQTIIETIDWLKNFYYKKEAITKQPLRDSWLDHDSLSNKNGYDKLPPQKIYTNIDKEITNNSDSNKQILEEGGEKVNIVKQNKKIPVITIQPPVVHFSILSIIKRSIYGGQKTLKSMINIIIGVLLLILILVILPQSIFSIGYRKIINDYNSNLTKIINSSKITKASNFSKLINNTTLYIEPLVLWQRKIIGNQTLKYISKITKSAQTLDLISQEMNIVNINSEKILDLLLGREVADLTQLQQDNKRSLLSIAEQIAFIEAETKQGNPKDLESELSKIKELRKVISNWQESNTMIPELFSFEGRRVVAVVLQDSLELRPTGGFLDSILFLTFDKGKLIDYQVKNIYELELQLKGTVKPPPDLAAIVEGHLAEKQWWLHDVNMYVDFPNKTAPRIAWYLEKQIGLPVNAVWAVDSYFFQDLLVKLGAVFLPEYNETISADNLLERQYSRSTSNLGSENSKQSFIQILVPGIMEKIKATHSSDLISLIPFLASEAEEKHFMVWTGENIESPQPLWSGGIRNIPNQVVEFGTLNISDFVMAVDANLTVNKVNYLINKFLDYEITLDDKSQNMVKLSYSLQNSSQTETWPSGSYRTMVWLYIPQIATLDKAQVRNDNAEVIEVKNSDILVQNEQDKQSVGIYLEVPPGSQRTLELTYMLPKPLENEGSYGLYIQKQSGIKKLPIHIVINYPNTFKVFKMSQEAKRSAGSLEFSQEINKDIFFAASFSR